MALVTDNPFESKGDNKTPTPEESWRKNGWLPNSNLKEPPSSEGNANIPECRLGYDKGDEDDLASKGLLGKKGKKKHG